MTPIRRSARGGLLLDGVLALVVVLLGSYALSTLGLTFGQILRGAAHFFGY